MNGLFVVILAAGKGKRTGLSYSKTLLPLCGKKMILWVIDSISSLGPEEILVVASPQNMVEMREIIRGKARVVVQEEPLGTGHALQCALKEIASPHGTLLVACGDTPLLTGETFSEILQLHGRKKAAATILTAPLANPHGYGRIVRNHQGMVTRIVEEKDAPSAILKIREINTGTYAFALDKLRQVLPNLNRRNKQNEYYLTDAIAVLVKRRGKVLPFKLEDERDGLGVNTLKELAEARQVLSRRLKEKWLEQGVIFTDPDSAHLDYDVSIGPDTVIHPYTFLENGTRIGNRCEIGPFARLSDSEIGDDCQVQNSVLLSAHAENHCRIGPFAYLRPGTRLESGVKVGDFVEIKNSTIGPNSKVPHLSYVGDATIGREVNIGAGVITCNYDGKEKHPTVIEDGAFIGSNTNLRAPVRVGKNAVTGAGSVVIKDVAPGAVVAGVPAKEIKKREAI